MRLLLWLGVIVVVLLWLQHAKKARLKSRAAQRPVAADRQVEAMVRCAHCGVHIPVSEAIGDPVQGAFCSEEHRARHRAG